MIEKIIDFPKMEKKEQESLQSLVGALAEHLHSPVTIETVAIIRIKYDGYCQEMDTILRQLAGDPMGLKIKKVRKQRFDTKPLHLANEKLDKGIDPNGS